MLSKVAIQKKEEIMKYIKKCMSILFVLLMFSLLTSTIIAKTENTLYAVTYDSQGADEYTRNTVYKHLKSLATIDNIDVSEAHLNKAIKVFNIKGNGIEQEMYYYPVELNNEVSYVFKVYRNEKGQNTGSLSKTITIDYTDVQGSNPSCCAHVTANILRTIKLGRIYTARGIMNYFNLSSNDSLSFSQAATYSRAQGVPCTDYTNGKPSRTMVGAEILANRPIYLSMRVDALAGHALVLHGCYSNMVIRNPWNTYSETMDYNSGRYISGQYVMYIKGYMKFG